MQKVGEADESEEERTRQEERAEDVPCGGGLFDGSVDITHGCAVGGEHDADQALDRVQSAKLAFLFRTSPKRQLSP